MPALLRAALDSLLSPPAQAIGAAPQLALLLAGIAALALVRWSRRR